MSGKSHRIKASGKSEIGLIAEEVAAIFPEVTTPDENGDPQVTYDDLDRVVIEADHVSADHPEGDPDRAAFESDNDLTD